MTSMQSKLYPPLEDDDQSDGDTSLSKNERDEFDAANNASSQSSVLSDELQDRFKSMRALLRMNDNHQFDEESNVELKRKQRQMALETALLVESEIAGLESGIAELEALLFQQQQRRQQQQHHLEQDADEPRRRQQQQQQQFLFDNYDVDQEDFDEDGDGRGGVPVFPSLPSIIYEEEDMEESEAKCSYEENCSYVPSSEICVKTQQVHDDE